MSLLLLFAGATTGQAPPPYVMADTVLKAPRLRTLTAPTLETLTAPTKHPLETPD